MTEIEELAAALERAEQRLEETNESLIRAKAEHEDARMAWMAANRAYTRAVVKRDAAH